MQPPNAALHLPRAQHIKHPSLADESRAIRGQVQALVRGQLTRYPLLCFYCVAQIDARRNQAAGSSSLALSST